MHLALNLVRIRPDRMPALAVQAEALGYEAVFVPDHVVLPTGFVSNYPGTPTGAFPYPRDTPLYDPLVVLSTIARATSTIKLGSAIYLLALRHPIMAARTWVTLDVLSGGRAVLGLGSGWLVEEFQALGIDPRTRFSRLEEAAVIVRRLWTEDEVSFSGRHFSFPALGVEPKPASRPHPPLLFGGDSEGSLRRAVRFGDGWISGGVSGVDEVGTRIATLTALRTELAAQGQALHGADDPFDITILHPNPSAEDLARLQALGVHRVVVMPWARPAEAPEAIERFRAMAAGAVPLD